MARLPYLDKADLSPDDADILARDINLHRVLANNPAAARAFIGLGQYIRHRSALDPRLRELAILQVGWLARSPYEWSHHVKIGHDFGVSDGDIEALIAETRGEETALDPTTRLVLRAAREIHDGPGVTDGDLRRAARRLRSGGDHRPGDDGELLLRRGADARLAGGGRGGELHALSPTASAAGVNAAPINLGERKQEESALP